MPFVLVNSNSQYLQRKNGRRRRSWTADLNEATTWSKTGPAINAAHAAQADWRLCHGKSLGELGLKEIKLIPGAIIRTVQPKKPR